MGKLPLSTFHLLGFKSEARDQYHLGFHGVFNAGLLNIRWEGTLSESFWQAVYCKEDCKYKGDKQTEQTVHHRQELQPVWILPTEAIYR